MFSESREALVFLQIQWSHWFTCPLSASHLKSGHLGFMKLIKHNLWSTPIPTKISQTKLPLIILCYVWIIPSRILIYPAKRRRQEHTMFCVYPESLGTPLSGTTWGCWHARVKWSLCLFICCRQSHGKQTRLAFGYPI